MLAGNFPDCWWSGRFAPDEALKQRILKVLYEKFEEQRKFSLAEATAALAQICIPCDIVIDHLKHLVETRFLKQDGPDMCFTLARKKLPADTISSVVMTIRTVALARPIEVADIIRVSREKHAQQTIRAAIDILLATGVVKVISNRQTKRIQWMEEQEGLLVMLPYFLQRYSDLSSELEKTRAKRRQIEIMLKVRDKR